MSDPVQSVGFCAVRILGLYAVQLLGYCVDQKLGFSARRFGFPDSSAARARRLWPEGRVMAFTAYQDRVEVCAGSSARAPDGSTIHALDDSAAML